MAGRGSVPRAAKAAIRRVRRRQGDVGQEVPVGRELARHVGAPPDHHVAVRQRLHAPHCGAEDRLRVAVGARDVNAPALGVDVENEPARL